MLHKTKSSGFTIVELAIIIVIIAILAIVTVASFDSVQKRAHESVTASNVEIFVGALEQIHQDTGRYPVAPSMSTLCIGASDCVNGSKYTGAGCGPIDGTVINSTKEASQVLNDELLKYIDELPQISTIKSLQTQTKVETEDGVCIVDYTSNGGITYESGVRLEHHADGSISLWRQFSAGMDDANTAAYRLAYTLPGDATCPTQNADRNLTVLPMYTVTVCNVYGGYATYE